MMMTLEQALRTIESLKADHSRVMRERDQARQERDAAEADLRAVKVVCDELVAALTMALDQLVGVPDLGAYTLAVEASKAALAHAAACEPLRVKSEDVDRQAQREAVAWREMLDDDAARRAQEQR